MKFRLVRWRFNDLEQKGNSMENKFNEDVKGNTAFSNPYDDSNWDGE